mmetsp:Transcript_2347/g.10380  ORF Transcript_2347/g.10380 Transcript_2347/m.10380 type:complete len:289 (+) Transcript_2347:160-1026(+)
MRRERRAQTAERGGRRDGDVAYPDAAGAGHAAAVHGHEDRALPHRRRRRRGGYPGGPTSARAGQHVRVRVVLRVLMWRRWRRWRPPRGAERRRGTVAGRNSSRLPPRGKVTDPGRRRRHRVPSRILRLFRRRGHHLPSRSLHLLEPIADGQSHRLPLHGQDGFRLLRLLRDCRLASLDRRLALLHAAAVLLPATRERLALRRDAPGVLLEPSLHLGDFAHRPRVLGDDGVPLRFALCHRRLARVKLRVQLAPAGVQRLRLVLHRALAPFQRALAPRDGLRPGRELCGG